MTLPRRSWPFLALAGLGACVLAVRGCVSVALAADGLPSAAGVSEWQAAAGGGIAGVLLALSVLLLVLWRVGLLPNREEAQAKRAAATTRADDEPTGNYRPVVARSEIEAMIDRECKDLRARMDEQHARVRETCRDLERRIIAADERARALEPALAPRLSNIESGLKELLRDTR